jgi:acetyl esterase
MASIWKVPPGMKWFWDQYLPHLSKRADIHVSPINASSEQLKGLPRRI